MMALEFESFEQNKKVIDGLLKEGVFTDWFLFASECLRIVPPLIISEDEILQGLRCNKKSAFTFLILKNQNNIMRVIKSFGWAFNGLKDCILHEKNFRIQYILALLVVIAGISLRFLLQNGLIILLCFALVLSFEIINSAIEKLCDLVCP